MATSRPQFELRIAQGEEDLRASQRLRYEVFVQELGGDGALVDHSERLERDEYDPYFDHLLLIDKAAPGAPVVGSYRVMRKLRAEALGRFYSEGEYDLGPLKASGRNLLELGRSCVHPDYRGGQALMRLWGGLFTYMETHDIDLMFGTASFHGTQIDRIAAPLSLLHHDRLAPPELRARTLPEHFQPMDLIAPGALDREAAQKEIPALIKAYMRLGAYVGEGAYVDHPFNTTDVLIIVDIPKVPTRQRELYARAARA